MLFELTPTPRKPLNSSEKLSWTLWCCSRMNKKKNEKKETIEN